jgi:hypothetical protein
MRDVTKRDTHGNVRDGKQLIWYADSLWRRSAELPIVQVPLESVKAWTGKPALDEDCWFLEHTRPTLREIVRHCRRINEATSGYPIILNDDGTLMDGGHRLCLALLEGRDAIAAVQFPTMPPPDEVHELPVP